MSTSVTMPRLGESVTEGTVTRWLKAEGEHVDADEPLLEVSTDKVDTEIPSPAGGTLLSIKVQEDETVEIGVELAVIGDSGEDGGATGEADAQTGPEAVSEPQSAPEPQREPEPEPQPEPQPEPEPEPQPEPEPATAPAQKPRPAPARAPVQSAPAQVAAPAPPASPADKPETSAAPAQPAPATEDDDVAGTYVTPLVRKLASEHQVDLSTIQGTGVGGRIRKSDVLAAAEKAAEPAAEPTTSAPASSDSAAAAAVQRGKVEPMSRMRQVIASRMVESLQTSAQLTTVVEVDVTRIARLRERAKNDFESREGVKLSFLPFFAVAAIDALKAHPVVNSSVNMDDKTITFHDAEHLGIAVDTDRGLLVPVIHDAGDLNLAGLARKIADLAERTRSNRVSPDELGGGTFTLTNTGSRGALFDTPIINQPQVGILGTGAVVKRPVVITSDDLGETIAVRSTMYLALSYDHRVVDGADAARFLVTMKERLEAGAFERSLGLS
ncbi:MAG: 2-oxoglutarate dehydrogenase, E2 component, dihydrolipoamide succinyltransferase [Jatrophihabitans sp.]